jgi:Tfp pilus assembly protein FimT
MKAQVPGKAQRWHSNSGRSLVEVLAVVAIATILTAVALPQVISARRLIRSSALPREIATQLRYARQQAMSQRQAFTFVYDDANKQISIIDHQTYGYLLLDAPGYPNTAGSVTVLTIPVGGGGLPASEVTFGVPSTITNTTLGDTGIPTALVNNKLTVTFQPNGTVQDDTGKEVNYRTLFFYNNVIPTETACAVSILGSAGRIKIWRYTTSASQYLE